MTENGTDENQLHLFSLEPDYKQYLIEGDVTDELKMAFKDNSYPISSNAKIIRIYEDKWKIIDGNKIYVIKDTSRQLNIYINPINFAIDNSIEFEELMDKTDFDSWLEEEETKYEKILNEKEEEYTYFENYINYKNELRTICDQMEKMGLDEIPKKYNKSHIVGYFIKQLVTEKNIRLKARICSKKEDEEKEYIKAISILLTTLSKLQNLERNISTNLCFILLFNDLSICYAGLENSSISRGYAEEAIKIIKKERGGNMKFNRKSRPYNLYTVALYNQAIAEKRSHLYTDAERNFKKLIKYAEKAPSLKNFNYYSALLNLSDLYLDLGRSKEAIELLKKIKESDKDIRYWKASITEINALIDQSDYDNAEKKLKKKFSEEKNYFSLVERHRITSNGFKALNCYARCEIEKVKNTLGNSDESKLKEVKNLLEKNIETLIDRKQEGLETKTYKHLSEIYKSLMEKKKSMKYSIKYLSKCKIENLNDFNKDKNKEKWINECDDLDFLENFSKELVEYLKDKPEDKVNDYKDLLNILIEKIKQECDDKGQLSRAERIVRLINEVLKDEKTDNIITEEFYEDVYKNCYPDKECLPKLLQREHIRRRLDINEKDFDKILFEGSNLKKDDHIVEVIILRRWNSFSPGLFRESTGSLGGGYLLRINKKLLGKVKSGDKKIENIVIDPGYNFLQNLRSEGFHVEDIDTIIVTHSHLDHCAELLPIMDLMYQFNKRYESSTPNGERQKKKVNLCLSRGAYNKFSSFTNEGWQEQLKDVIILENHNKEKWKPFENLNLSILVINTPHLDLGGENAIGLKIEINRNNKKKLCLGFTSDTPWLPKIKKEFRGCDLLCVHLGSIKYQEIGYNDKRYEENKREIAKEDITKELKKIYSKSNHLYFYGTLKVIEDCCSEDKSLVIVGEFGEELKYGLRIDLCKRLSKKSNTDCLPGDIGLYIGIEENKTKKVRCNFCEEFVKQEEIETFSFGREDAIQYICKTCNKTLSELQKQAIIEHRVTRH
jgi:tetratricopeptide (TPR) repeat protein